VLTEFDLLSVTILVRSLGSWGNALGVLPPYYRARSLNWIFGGPFLCVEKQFYTAFPWSGKSESQHAKHAISRGHAPPPGNFF